MCSAVSNFSQVSSTLQVFLNLVGPGSVTHRLWVIWGSTSLRLSSLPCTPLQLPSMPNDTCPPLTFWKLSGSTSFSPLIHVLSLVFGSARIPKKTLAFSQTLHDAWRPIKLYSTAQGGSGLWGRSPLGSPQPLGLAYMLDPSSCCPVCVHTHHF